MAFAAPDPKRVKADAERLRQRELDDLAVIEAERRIKREIRACYFVGEQTLNGERVEGHSPKQIANAGRMIQAGEMARHIDKANALSKAGISTWIRVGRSRGGKHKGNLYTCNSALVARTTFIEECGASWKAVIS
jgi:hypothetical protein